MIINNTGEQCVLKARNTELFISEQALVKLQNLFYTKSITPKLLIEHSEYMQFLNGKNLGYCIKTKEIRVKEDNKYN